MPRASCVANGARSKCRATPRKSWPPPLRSRRQSLRSARTRRPLFSTSPDTTEPSLANRRKTTTPRRVFVLDTNVMMHDPSAIFRFEEHDIFIPMTVLEELDAGKKGVSESARNVRQVSRFLDELMGGADKQQIDRGIELPPAKYAPSGKNPPSGRLFFQTRQLTGGLPDTLPGHGADNAILSQTLALQQSRADARITLVSKDINLRIKAAIIGIHAEDYN